MTQKIPLVFLTHIDKGAFCDRFFGGSILPGGEALRAAG